MSYILDALKKAEADSDPDARASLAMAQHERRRTRLLAFGLAIALIINAGILLWLFLPLSIPATTATPPPPEAAATAEPATGQPSASWPAVRPDSKAQPAPAGTPDPVIPARAPAGKPPAMTAESATGDTIIRPGGIRPDGAPALPVAEPVPVSSLPRNQQDRFPALEFSTHVYADDAELRAIVVNGVRLQEGDRLENVRLHEITEDGAVFAFENRLVSVSVLDAWD